MKKVLYLMAILLLPVLLVMSGPLVSTAEADGKTEVCHNSTTESRETVKIYKSSSTYDADLATHTGHGDPEDECDDVSIDICHNPDSDNQDITITWDDWKDDKSSHTGSGGKHSYPDTIGACSVVTYSICHRTESGYTKLEGLTLADYNTHSTDAADVVADECPSTSTVSSGANPASSATAITGVGGVGQGKTAGRLHNIKPRTKKR